MRPWDCSITKHEIKNFKKITAGSLTLGFFNQKIFILHRIFLKTCVCVLSSVYYVSVVKPVYNL